MKRIGLLLAFVPLFAFATPGAYDSITTAVDFAEVATAVVAIAALIAVAYVAMTAGHLILGFIGGDDLRDTFYAQDDDGNSSWSPPWRDDDYD